MVTPVGIMNKFVRERGTAGATMDFVLFLYTPPVQNLARRATVEACCESAKRPKGFNE